MFAVHPLDGPIELEARPDRARPGGHRLFDADVVLARECRLAELTQHDLLVVDDEAGIPAGVADAGANMRQLLSEAAGGYVAAEMRPDAGVATARAFERQSGRAPVGFARGVVMNLGEADALEPPRGSRAQVSLGVVAVDDHRPAALELVRRPAVELLERNVDRPWQVHLFEVGAR